MHWQPLPVHPVKDWDSLEEWVTESPADCWSHSQAREAGTHQDAALGAAWWTLHPSAWSLVQDINCQSCSGPRNTDSLVFMLPYRISGPFYVSHLVVIHLCATGQNATPTAGSLLAVRIPRWCWFLVQALLWPRNSETDFQPFTENEGVLDKLCGFGYILYRDYIQHISVGGFKLHSDDIVLFLLHWESNTGLYAHWIDTPAISHLHSLGVLVLNATLFVE